MQVYYETDANVEALRGRRIGVLGYGSQGRAHALNLRDGDYQVIVGQRPGGPRHAQAVADGFEPCSIGEVVEGADLLILALPDEAMGEIHGVEIGPRLRGGQALGFLHGFAIRFGAVRPPSNVDVIMVAPKGPGALVRDLFVRGAGLTCVVAVQQNATGRAKEIALAWGAAIGGGKGGMLETSFAEECESDLFGEQAVLCGGVIELMKAAFETLTAAGYPAELAYIECIHELKQIVDLQYAGGLRAMRERISSTAAYGGLTRGPRLVTEETRRVMADILEEIRSGRFAAEWIEECRKGKPALARLESAEASCSSEGAAHRVLEIVARAMSGRR